MTVDSDQAVKLQKLNSDTIKVFCMICLLYFFWSYMMKKIAIEINILFLVYHHLNVWAQYFFLYILIKEIGIYLAKLH